MRQPSFIVGIAAIAFFAIATFFLVRASIQPQVVKNEPRIPMSYHANIIKDTQENENFRRVLFTGPKSQLVVMSIPPGGEVGEETHKYTEQTLFFLSGMGEGDLDGKKFQVGPGDVVVVTAGTKHNFRNTGTQALKIYTVYAPPNHIDGRVHLTKAEADADTADEAVGESEP
jgi:mannose-6-phosphate isomerase-like protein (cupin superfamily)